MKKNTVVLQIFVNLEAKTVIFSAINAKKLVFSAINAKNKC